jgi:hypothetical protein
MEHPPVDLQSLIERVYLQKIYEMREIALADIVTYAEMFRISRLGKVDNVR